MGEESTEGALHTGQAGKSITSWWADRMSDEHGGHELVKSVG